MLSRIKKGTEQRQGCLLGAHLRQAISLLLHRVTKMIGNLMPGLQEANEDEWGEEVSGMGGVIKW